jgi:hypothetical protein
VKEFNVKKQGHNEALFFCLSLYRNAGSIAVIEKEEKYQKENAFSDEIDLKIRAQRTAICLARQIRLNQFICVGF